MFRLLESGPTKQQLWELPTSRPEFGNSQFGVRGFVITGLIRQVEENLELRDLHRYISYTQYKLFKSQITSLKYPSYKIASVVCTELV